MKHQTFELLYRAYFGDVDQEALRNAMDQESDEFVRYQIRGVLKKVHLPVQWDVTPFTTDFRSVRPHQRLDETVITFLLYAAAIVKDEAFRRSFTKPESCMVVAAWMEMLKGLMYAVLTLTYDITWTVQDSFKLSETVLILLHEGKVTALRDFMRKQLRIVMIREDLFQAERLFESLAYLHVGQFSSFFWRVLHWMAEAVNARSNQPDAKKMWFELIVGPMYRMLRCSICSFHFKGMVDKLKSDLTDESKDHAKLWFDLHNQVHAERREKYLNIASKEVDYTAQQYEEDAEFMREALKKRPKNQEDE